MSILGVQARRASCSSATGAFRSSSRPGAGPPLPAPASAAGPSWAPTLALATVDLARRQALAQAAAEEEALVLMLVLLEEL